MDRDSYKSLAEAYEQIQEQGNTKRTKVTSGQVAGGVDRMILRNLQRYIDNAIKAGRGIYDKSKEAGDAIIKGTADFTSDRITGGNTGDTIIRDRQKEAEKARQAIGADSATDTLTNPGGALNNILKQSGLPAIPGIGGNQQNVSREGETPAERAARRERVGLTGNGEAGSPTGITPEVAAKQNAADAAAGRSTVRDTATGEPTNVDGGSDSTPETAATPKDTGGGGSSAGLTPMQQWAKNFPKLAAKVKPGQAGYDEIQKMNSGSSSSPQNVSRNFQSSAPNLGAQTNIPKPAPITPQPLKTTPAASNFSQAASNLGKAAGVKIASRVPKAPAPPKPPKPMDRIDQATTNVGKWNEETLLQSLSDAYNDISEAHPEPKVHWKKDMDPYDPRRAPRDHAPGSPLPPPSYRPGLPNMKLAKSKDERKPKKA